MCCKRLAGNAGPKKSPKIRYLNTIAQLFRATSSQLRHLSAAEIVSLVWSTPANFNGFHVLGALLHGTLVVGVSRNLRRWTEGATIFVRAAITLGIGPHSSSYVAVQLLTVTIIFYCL